jgi:MFS family permease
MLPLFQVPLNLITEISSIEGRAMVIGFACVTWALGNMALPLFGWLIASWKWIRVVCVVPMVFVFLTWKIVPESPRWLVTKGRMQEAKAILVTLRLVKIQCEFSIFE